MPRDYYLIENMDIKNMEHVVIAKGDKVELQYEVPGGQCILRCAR